MVYGYIKCGIAVAVGCIVCVGCGVKVSVGRIIVTIGVGKILIGSAEDLQLVMKIKITIHAKRSIIKLEL